MDIYLFWATFITALATLALTFVTYRHVSEAKKSRKLLEETLNIEKERIKLENAPVLYIEKIETSYRVNVDDKELRIKPRAFIRNAGQSSAKNLRIKHIISRGTLKDEKNIDPVDSIYKNQITTLDNLFILKITDDLSEKMGKELNEKVPFSMFPNINNAIIWNLNFHYEDSYGKEYVYDGTYQFKYPSWTFTLRDQKK